MVPIEATPAPTSMAASTSLFAFMMHGSYVVACVAPAAGKRDLVANFYLITQMSPPIPPQWADISTWTDVNGGGDGAQRGAIPKGIEHGRVSPALWHGGPMPCRTCGNALARWLCVPEVCQHQVQLLRAEAPLSMYGVPPANIGPIRNHLPQITHAADQVVPSDALDDEREERYRRTRIGAPARRQMGHCLAHETEADGGDETAQFHLQACWPRAGR